MNNIQLTDNERKIITLLYKKGPLSKPQLKSQGHMSWATVVKIINRLLNEKMIECIGTSERAVHKGKNSYIYRLTGKKPLAVGVDIEYREMNIILTNLSGTILKSRVYPTPQNPDAEELRTVLFRVLSDFIAECGTSSKEIVGIGIGIPGISIPSWLTESSPNKDKIELAGFLEDQFSIPVCTENNVRAYAMFEKWDKRTFSIKDFIFLSIRTGLGSGIVLNGTIYPGQQGLAGEIGHITAKKDGELCRCGKKGCLETLVNQNVLYSKYLDLIEVPIKNYTNEDLEKNLGNLFTMARDGNQGALEIVSSTADSLAPHIANLIMMLNIKDVIISGYFGMDGSILVDLLEEKIVDFILPKIQYSLRYYPLDDKGFIRGAALLILQRFFSDFFRNLET